MLYKPYPGEDGEKIVMHHGAGFVAGSGEGGDAALETREASVFTARALAQERQIGDEAADDDAVHRRLDVAALRRVGIVRQAPPRLVDVADSAKNGDTVPALLAVPDCVVAEVADLLAEPPHHVVGGGDPITRVGLTTMQVMGLPVEKWGARSLQTSKTITEVVA